MKQRRKKKCIPLDKQTAGLWASVFGDDEKAKAKLIFALEAVPGQKYMHPLKNSVIEFVRQLDDGQFNFLSYQRSGEKLGYFCKAYAPIRVDDAGVALLMVRHEAARKKLYGSGGTKQPAVRRVQPPAKPTQPIKVETGFAEGTSMHSVAMIVHMTGTGKDQFKTLQQRVCEHFGFNPHKEENLERVVPYIKIVQAQNPDWWSK